MAFYGGGTVQGALRLQGRTSPGLSAAGEGRIYFDSGTNEFLVSENGGAYVPLTADAETLAETLAAGNVTGGNDIVVSTGDEILGAAELNLNAANGDNLWIGGTGSQAIQIGASSSFYAAAGDIVLEPAAGAGAASYVGIYGSSATGAAAAGTIDMSGGNGDVHDNGGDAAIGGGPTALAGATGGDIYVRGGQNSANAANHGRVRVGDSITREVLIGDAANASQTVNVLTGGTLGLRGGAGGTFIGVNATNYWSIDASGNGSLTTATGGSLSLSADLGGVGLTTEDVADDYAGGLWMYGGDATAGSAPGTASGGWLDFQGGSCTGGQGEGGWIQIGAGNGRDAQGGFFQMWAGTCTTADGDGGFFQIDAGDGGPTGGSGGYLGLFAGDARGGTDDGGDVTIDAGNSVGGTAGVVDVGRTKASAVNIGGQNNATNFTSGSTQLGSTSNGTGLILVKPGFTSIADGSSLAAGLEFGPLYYDTKNGTYVQFGNSVYIDGTNQIVRSGDGADVHTTNSSDIAAANATFDLSTLGAVDADPLEPGTVEIRVILNGGTVFSTTTDDGAGNFPVSAVLPAGGTVNYAARTLTGVTAGLRKYSRVQVAFANSNTAGEALTVRAGDASGTAVSGGALTIRSGAGGTTSGNSGAVSIDVGSVTSGTAGTVSVGTTNASAVTIGRSGVTTTVNGTLSAAAVSATTSLTTPSLESTGSVALGAITSVSGNTTLDATNAIVLVDASGGPVTITLPAAAGSTRRHYTIKKIDSSANAVTVDGDGAETIDGATTQSLAVQYDALEVVSNGTAWFIV